MSLLLLTPACSAAHRDPPGGSSDEGQGAGRSQADDVCPWDAGPPKALAPEQVVQPGPAPGPGRISRKNSSQMDSGGSSSDISIAIAEVSTRPARQDHSRVKMFELKTRNEQSAKRHFASSPRYRKGCASRAACSSTASPAARVPPRTGAA